MLEERDIYLEGKDKNKGKEYNQEQIEKIKEGLKEKVAVGKNFVSGSSPF